MVRALVSEFANSADFGSFRTRDGSYLAVSPSVRTAYKICHRQSIAFRVFGITLEVMADTRTEPLVSRDRCLTILGSSP